MNTLHQHTYRFRKRGTATAQGLVEYALILVLVAVVVIGGVSQFGDEVSNVYCEIITVLDPQSVLVCDNADDSAIQITQSQYNADGNRITIRATYNGGYDPNVMLTAHPGGQLVQQGNQYTITMTGTCPCSVRLSSSSGESTNVDVN